MIKKIIAFLLTIAFVMTTSVTALAAPPEYEYEPPQWDATYYDELCIFVVVWREFEPQDEIDFEKFPSHVEIFAFVTKKIQTDSAFTYMGQYNPRIGRFTQSDPLFSGGYNPNDPSGLNIYNIMQSSNLYVYALNNPIMWHDPSGLVIEYKTNHLGQSATPEQIYQYERAIEYLLDGSAKFKELYDILVASDQVIYIHFNNQFASGYNEKTDWGTRVIVWDPTAGARFDGSNLVVSAANILAHEMGHAQQHLAGEFDAFMSAKTPVEKAIARATIEANNLINWETPIAGQLGENTRNKYGGGTMIRTGNSTDWGVMVWKPGILPWHWGREVYESKNTWTPTTTVRPIAPTPKPLWQR